MKWFLLGTPNDGDYISQSAPGTIAVLDTRSFSLLRNLRGSDEFQFLWLPTERLIAVSLVEKTHDRDKRETRLNHTWLFTPQEYIDLTKNHATEAIRKTLLVTH